MEKSPSLWINTATYSDGTTLTFSQGDIVVFVGPNNSGKSAALRGKKEKLSNPKSPNPVLKEIYIQSTGSGDEARDWVEQRSKPHPGAEHIYSALGAQFQLDYISTAWNSTTNLQDLARFFYRFMDAESRLTAANPPGSISLTSGIRQHPIHYIQADDSLESLVSNYFYKAFGQELIVHRNAGNEVPIYCGKKPKMGPGQDRVSIEYSKELEKLTPLHKQGDGMRSFAAILLNVFTLHFPLIFIDEPEAFLHPPQARLLGQMLAREAKAEQQLFIATHSGDFLRGLIDANRGNVRVVRLRRENDVNIVKELDNQNVQQLWKDPLLRFSNVLDGLFHEKVIICESDGDCRFYGAVLDALYDGDANSVKPDVMFTHCGGKQRIPTVVRALQKLRVPLAAVTDFDILHGMQPLRSIYEELGGIWTDIFDDWTLVQHSIEEKKAEASSDEIRTEIQNILKRVSDPHFPETEVEEIKKVLKKCSPWSMVKTAGKSFIPSGDATQAFCRLCNNLADQGLFVVEVGELERFVPSVGGHGPAWVNKVLEKNLLTDPELDAARKFVRKLVPDAVKCAD